jgi:iron complex transport system substrate-binding protein
VVSLTPSLTEILFSLGAGGRVVGVTANDTYPPQVRDLPKVGDMNLDYEKIVALHPDVVVVDGSIAGEERLARLQELGIPVRSFESQSLEGLQATLLELGRLTGTEERARQLARRFADGIAEVRRRAAHMPRRPRVFVEIQDSPLMTAGGRHSRGGQTFVDLMISLAGGVNAYADLMDYPQVSPEDLLERDPDVIVLLSPPHRQVSQAVRRPGWDRLRAVKEGRVHLIEADLLVRPTLRTLVALQELQGWFTRAAAAP